MATNNQFNPDSTQYDYLLGIDSDLLDYIQESAEIESRISPVRCYLLQQHATGSSVGSSSSRITVSSYVDTDPNYRAVIWSSGSSHPDLRPYVNNGAGAVFVYIDSVQATRVLEVEDLLNDNEFAVVKRKDLNPARVEIVFNAGFNASLHTIEYYFSTMQEQIDITRVKRGEQGNTQSQFGWSQYLNTKSDAFRGKHQILVRMPLTTRDLIINEEGRVTLEENDSWMIWTPYVRDFDVLIVPADQAINGLEERYEIINKRDSVIQGRLITQRFKLKLLERSDPRYTIPYSTT